MIRILIFLIFILSIEKTYACISITDDLNTSNPVISANFNLLPELGVFKDCFEGSIRIRTNRSNWRLIANRVGPEPIRINGDPKDNIKPKDITFLATLKAFGKAPSNGGVLVSPFFYETDLSSIQSGTLIASGIKKSDNSCSPHNSSFYQIRSTLCLFRDFVFNVGEYNGEVSYTVIAP